MRPDSSDMSKLPSPICRGLRPKNRPVGSSDVSSDQRYLAVAALAQGSLEAGSLQVLVLAASTDARLALLNFDAQQHRCSMPGLVHSALQPSMRLSWTLRMPIDL